jgi:hypothetical protein
MYLLCYYYPLTQITKLFQYRLSLHRIKAAYMFVL